MPIAKHPNGKAAKIEERKTKNNSSSSELSDCENPGCEQKAELSERIMKMIYFGVLAAAALTCLILSALLLTKCTHDADGTAQPDAMALRAVEIETLMNRTEHLLAENRNTSEIVQSLHEKNKIANCKFDLLFDPNGRTQNQPNCKMRNCPSTGFVYNGYCFVAITDLQGSYSESKRRCLQNDSFPAFIENELMYKVLYDYLVQQMRWEGLGIIQLWLGENYDHNSGKMYFEDGRESKWHRKWRPEYPRSNAGYTQIQWRVADDDSSSGFINLPPTTEDENYRVLCQRPL